MPAMAQTTIATNFCQALDVHGNFAAQITFYDEATVDDLSQYALLPTLRDHVRACRD